MSNQEDVKAEGVVIPKITVKVANAAGAELCFQLKNTTRIGKIMTLYCQKHGLVPGSVRFMFDGQRIHPNSTPAMLDMSDGDVIDSMVEQTGGWGWGWGWRS